MASSIVSAAVIFSVAFATAGVLASCSTVLGLTDPTLNPDASVTNEAGVGGFSHADGSSEGGGPQTDAAFDSSVGSDAAGCTSANLATDRLHCGRCGHDCLGADCVGGLCQPVTLATAQAEPRGIAVDGTYVYWTNYAGNEIRRAQKTDGGGATTLATNGVVSPWGVAVDEAGVYWANYDFSASSGDGSLGSIRRCPLAGCNNSVPAPLLTSADHPIDLAIQGSRVFYTESNAGNIVSADKFDGGSLVTVTKNVTQPFHLALDARHVYYTSAQNDMYRVPLDGGTDEVFGILNGDRAGGIAVDNTRVYWAFDFDNRPGTVMSKPLEGGTIVVYAGPNPNPLGIASDGRYVYFTNLGAGTTLAQRTNGSVMACPVGGCSAAGPMVLASEQHNANAIALDADAVYFTTAGLGSNDGTVMKVAKP